MGNDVIKSLEIKWVIALEQAERRKKAIELLKNYKNNKVAIEMLKLDRQAIDSMIINRNMALSYDQPNGGQTNAINSTVENDVISIEQKRNEFDQQIALLQNQVDKVDKVLDNVPYVYKRLLELKYIERLCWSEIARLLSYDVSYVKKELKDKAIDAFCGYIFPEVHMVNLFEKPTLYPHIPHTFKKNMW